MLWTILKECGVDVYHNKLVEVRCVCGKTAIVRATTIKSGKSKGCAACRNSRATRWQASHGHWKGNKSTATWRSWQAMHVRCRYPKHPAYHRYGGRGISVCQEWFDFGKFLADMGERPSGHSLDRIDNNGHYCKKNCRWSTPKEQAANRKQRGQCEL